MKGNILLTADQLLTSEMELKVMCNAKCFSSLTISISTINQFNIKNVPENVTIELVKEEYRYVGLHKLLRNTVIQLPYGEFLQLKSSTDSIQSFRNFTVNYVKRPVEAGDIRQQHQASETSTIP